MSVGVERTEKFCVGLGGQAEFRTGFLLGLLSRDGPDSSIFSVLFEGISNW